MTNLVALHSSSSLASRRSGRTSWLGVTLAIAAFAGVAFGRARAGDAAAFESALVVLLRFMAACKAACVIGAAALLAWRLRRPLTFSRFACYLAATALMALAPGLIWSLGPIAPGALVFHAGLLAFRVLAARDGGLAARRRRCAPHPALDPKHDRSRRHALCRHPPPALDHGRPAHRGRRRQLSRPLDAGDRQSHDRRRDASLGDRDGRAAVGLRLVLRPVPAAGRRDHGPCRSAHHAVGRHGPVVGDADPVRDGRQFRPVHRGARGSASANRRCSRPARALA